MSVKVMADVFLMKNLPPREKLVLLAYADHAHDDGTHVYPAIESIAKKVSMSYRTVFRATQQLETWGLLVRDGKWKKGVNRWQIDTSVNLADQNLADEVCQVDICQSDTSATGGIEPMTRVADKSLLTISDVHKEKEIDSEPWFKAMMTATQALFAFPKNRPIQDRLRNCVGNLFDGQLNVYGLGADAEAWNAQYAKSFQRELVGVLCEEVEVTFWQ